MSADWVQAVNDTMQGMKEELKELSDQWWEKEQKLWDHHEEVITLEEWGWLLKELITEKKKNNKGPTKIT